MGINDPANKKGWVGKLDEVKIYSRALSAAEILAEKNLQFVDEGLTDSAMSMFLGGASGAGIRKLAELGKPAAALARQAGITESLLTTGIKTGYMTS